MSYRETDKDGVTYTLTAVFDSTPVRGNASACGDDTVDRQYEDEIIDRLQDGDVWAWALVTVKAEIEGFTGEEALGSCSYRDERDFRESSGYWEDMKSEARLDLIRKLEEAVEAGETARDALDRLGVKA